MYVKLPGMTESAFNVENFCLHILYCLKFSVIMEDYPRLKVQGSYKKLLNSYEKLHDADREKTF